METVNKVFITRKFSCSASELFEWLIQPKLIAQWFGPKNLSVGEVKLDLQIGGQISIELKKVDGQHFFIKGKYQEISQPNYLTFSYAYEGLENPPPNSIVKIKLEEIDSKHSLLTLTQDFEFTPSDMHSRTKAWEHMFQLLSNQTVK